MLDRLIYKEQPREKTHFSSSDFGKWDLELYLRMTGVQPTNDFTVWDRLKLEAGNAVETVLVQALQDSGVVEEYYMQEFDGRVVMNREGIEIHGYMDAVSQKNDLDIVAGVPIEIKSINNKNNFDISKYAAGNPRENYVGQLATYIDYMGVDIGYLLVATIDGLSRFLFKCEKKADGIYQCGNIVVDVNEEYKRWSRLKREHIDKGIMPDVFGLRYKYPLDEIDWHSLSNGAISKARNNQAVIGDWQVTYSPYKDMILKLQGTEPGYTEEELAIIKEKTQGYTTWSK